MKALLRKDIDIQERRKRRSGQTERFPHDPFEPIAFIGPSIFFRDGDPEARRRCPPAMKVDNVNVRPVPTPSMPSDQGKLPPLLHS